MGNKEETREFDAAYEEYRSGDKERAGQKLRAFVQNYPDTRNSKTCQNILADSYGAKSKSTTTTVIVKKVDIPFWSLTGFLIKLIFAAIPATIIAAITISLVGGILAAMGINAFR